MFQGTVDLRQSLGRVFCKNAGGKARERGVRFTDFSGIFAQRVAMFRDRGEIAASDRSGPCGLRAVMFKIIERLAQEGQQRLSGATTREAELRQHLRSCFGES